MKINNNIAIFLGLVAVLVYSYIRARKINDHQQLKSTTDATNENLNEPVLVPTQVVE